jgi:hypothetical protein
MTQLKVEEEANGMCRITITYEDGTTISTFSTKEDSTKKITELLKAREL